MPSNRQLDRTLQSIATLLDRLDPSPRETCRVAGCTHLHHESFVAAGVGTV